MENFIYDTKTANESFIETALELKEQGIENYSFFLRLNDASLADVNPFDPELTEEQRYAIMNEVRSNPWYFLRECVRIQVQGSSVGNPFELHRGNLASIFCILNNLDHYVTTPRTTYRSISQGAILNWIFNYGTMNTKMVAIGSHKDNANLNLKKMYELNSLLPKYLSASQFYIQAQYNLYHPSLQNTFRAAGSALNSQNADDIGRRLVEPIQVFDDAEYISMIDILYNASLPPYRMACERANLYNQYHCRILSSTHGDDDMPSTKFCISLIKNALQWSEKFYDLSSEEIQNIIKRDSSNGLIYIKYEYHQLRKDEQWLKNNMRALNNNEDIIRRELLLKRKDEI